MVAYFVGRGVGVARNEDGDMTGDDQLDYALLWWFIVVVHVALYIIFSGGKEK